MAPCEIEKKFSERPFAVKNISIIEEGEITSDDPLGAVVFPPEIKSVTTFPRTTEILFEELQRSIIVDVVTENEKPLCTYYNFQGGIIELAGECVLVLERSKAPNCGALEEFREKPNSRTVRITNKPLP